MDIDITAHERQILLNLLQTYLPDSEVWAFGSRVKFTAKPESDLDLVVFIEPEQEENLIELKRDFELITGINTFKIIPINTIMMVVSDFLLFQDIYKIKKAPDVFRSLLISYFFNSVSYKTLPV